MLAASYDPWADVRAHHNWRVGRGPLPRKMGGTTEHEDGITYLILRSGQTAIEERAALAEEVAHAERVSRGRVLPTDTHRDPLNRREERLCRLTAALRLVGMDAVRRMVREVRASGRCNIWLHAEDLGVPGRLLLDLLNYVGGMMGPIRPWWLDAPRHPASSIETKIAAPSCKQCEAPALSPKHQAWAIRPYFMEPWAA